MAGELRTRRWNDPVQPGDGTRVLVCRYRPRGVPKATEPWHEWWSALAPSVALHAAAYGKQQSEISFSEYTRRYRAEMTERLPDFHLRALANRVAAGETLTLLCSSACTDETQCHRSLLRELILRRLPRAKEAS